MASRTAHLTVTLPAGPTPVSIDVDEPEGGSAGTVLIAHGAGAGYRHPFLVGFAAGLVHAGFTAMRFNFPYVEAGRRMPGPAAHAVATWAAADAFARAQGDGPVWAAGKSYGGRMASMAAAEGAISPDGLVYLGYPLHPPGSPDKARVTHLPAVPQPQLFVEGTNDPFIDPHSQLIDAVASCQDAEISWIDGGGHSFEVKGRKRPAEEIGAELAGLVAGWISARAR